MLCGWTSALIFGDQVHRKLEEVVSSICRLEHSSQHAQQMAGRNTVETRNIYGIYFRELPRGVTSKFPGYEV
jgi:hypothetical protein